MDDDRWKALRVSAVTLVDQVLAATGATTGATVEWFRGTADGSLATLYRVDPGRKTVGLDQDVVSRWFRELPEQDAAGRFAGLALRAAAAIVFAPPAYAWHEAAERHVRSEQEQGLDETYGLAFTAAHQILEHHRLDHRVLELMPDAGGRLAVLIESDLEAHPAFDTYPRAAIVMGRPNLPDELAQPAFDEFVDRFGVDEAEELRDILGEYVAVQPDAIEEMVDLTARLVFQAFPEAMGLAWGDGPDGGVESSEIWPLQRTLPSTRSVGWDELGQFVAATLNRFTGEAGLDYGDALLIGVGDAPSTGRRVGAWARPAAVELDVTHTGFDDDRVATLLARGWEQFKNAPDSFFKSATDHPDLVAAEVIWILRRLFDLPSTGGLTLWGRGPAVSAAEALGL
jgi:hypothetical protein